MMDSLSLFSNPSRSSTAFNVGPLRVHRAARRSCFESQMHSVYICIQLLKHSVGSLLQTLSKSHQGGRILTRSNTTRAGLLCKKISFMLRLLAPDALSLSLCVYSFYIYFPTSVVVVDKLFHDWPTVNNPISIPHALARSPHHDRYTFSFYI